MDLIIDAMSSRRRRADARLGAKVEDVLPEGKTPVFIDQAESVELQKVESLYPSFSLCFGSSPMNVLRLPTADPKFLKASLAKALAMHPVFAGRLSIDRIGGAGQVKLTNQGVPFTVVQMAEPSAPTTIEESKLLSYCDLRNPRSIMRGIEPVMTVKLITFKDGSAILGLANTHAIADGSYMWAFISAWARAARGDTLPGPVDQDRTAMQSHNKWRHDAEGMQKLQEEELGCRLEYMVGVRDFFFRGMQVMDFVFLLAGQSKGTARKRIFFPNSSLERIKQVATPAPGSGGDGFVTTQEALGAHILLALARVIIPTAKKPRSPPRCAIWFVLDIRRKFGLPADHPSGVGATRYQIIIDDPFAKSLSEVATIIHQKVNMPTEEYERQWALFAGSCEHDSALDFFWKNYSQKQSKHGTFDLEIGLNNLSKRIYPDFGAGGGKVTAALTDVGPCLLYPADGGVDLFLHDDTFMGAPAEKIAEALRAISEIP